MTHEDAVGDGGGHDHGHREHEHHTHEHHGHEHPPAEVLPPPSGVGSVMLEIGGDRGALIVHTPEHLDGFELEIRPEPGEWVGEHVAVRPRELATRTVWTATFDSLVEGRYVVRVRFGPDGATEVPAEVTGGRVAQVTWPEA